MKVSKKIVAATCAASLSGCSVFTYPDGPKLTSSQRPVPLNDAIEIAEKLERSYLEAAGDQILVDKIAKLSFVASAGTAIAGALYGAHRDLITGAAFAGGAVYAGSTLLGSANQRLVYRTGAQALSCAITAVSPLSIVDSDALQTAQDNIANVARDFTAKVIDLENAMDAVPRPALSSANYGNYNTKKQAVMAAIATAASKVDAAIADSTGASDAAARTELRNANKALSDYQVAALNAKGHSDTITTASAYQALDKAKLGLEGLKKTPTYAAWMDAQIDQGLQDVAELRKLQGQADTLRAKATKAIIDADTAVLRARIDLEGWRTLPHRMEADRARATKILSDIKGAGDKLFSASKNIHIKVVNELERFEPDRGAILRAFSSVTGAALTNASTITGDRDAIFGDGSSLPAPSTNTQQDITVAAGGAAPVAGGGAPVGGGAPAGGPPAAPLADTPANRQALQQQIDSAFNAANMPAAASLQGEIRAYINLISQIETTVEGSNGLTARHMSMRTAAGAIRLAHVTVKDQVSIVQNVDLANIQSTCIGLINPGVKPLRVNTNQIQVDNTTSKYVYVSGGRGEYFAQYDQPTLGLEITPKFDPDNGKFRFEIKPVSGFAAGKTYKMTIVDEDNLKADVTIVTK